MATPGHRNSDEVPDRFEPWFEPPPSSWWREIALFLLRLVLGVPLFAIAGIVLWFAYQDVVRPLFGKVVLTFEYERSRPAEELREDLGFLRSALEEHHPGLFAHQTPEEMDAAFKRVESHLGSDQSPADFLVEAAPLVAAVGCGHTGLRPSMLTTRSAMSGGRFLPLGVRFIEDRAYLVNHYARRVPIPRGAELLSMNGIALQEVRRRLLASLPSDRRSPTYNLALAESQFLYWYWVFIDRSPRCEVRYRDPVDDSVKEVVVRARSARRILGQYRKQHPELDPDRPPPAMEMTIISDRRVAYLRLYTFAPQHRPGSRDALREFFAEIEKSKVESLVLDLRGNAGGPPPVSVDLLRYLLAEPFVYLEEPEPVGHRALGYDRYYSEFEPHALRFPGRLFVLIGPGSFSTTGHFLAHLAAHDRAIFVGRESGGGALCYDASQHLELPHTRLRLRVATLPFQAAVPARFTDLGIVPDYEVQPDVRDLVAGRDTVMTFLRERFDIDFR